MTETAATAKLDDFLASAEGFVAEHAPACRAFWLAADEPSVESVVPLDPAGVTAYLRPFLQDTTFATLRGSSTGGATRLDIVLWEEWGGEFAVPRWIATDDTVLFEAVWAGADA